ncbi:MAG: hypothetical protein Q8K85_23595, partial [Hyphomicrobium sp.]|nr:hypothetical protein [Hyphomicrobium sp.]
ALAASPAQSRTCQWSSADDVQVDRAVRAMYQALKTDDRAAFQRSVTPDFLAFEVGRRWSADELFTTIVNAHRSGRVINWSIGPMVVRGDCNSAWAAWDNVGSAGVPPAIAPRHWMESAMLRRSTRGWQVEFLHSTVVAPPPAK